MSQQDPSVNRQHASCRVWVLPHKRSSKLISFAPFKQKSPDTTDLATTIAEGPSEGEPGLSPPDLRSARLVETLRKNPRGFINSLLDSTSYAFEISDDITEASFSKHLAQPAGGFNISLKPRKNYLAEVGADDFVLMQMDNGAGEEAIVTVGLVDRITRQRRATPDFATTDSILINGRDLGKVLTDTSVFLDPEFFRLDLVGFLNEMSGVSKGKSTIFGIGLPAHEVVPLIIRAFASLQFKLEVPPSERATFVARGLVSGRPLPQFVFPGTGQPIVDLLELGLEKDGGFVSDKTVGALAQGVIPASGSITLWSLVEQFSNRVVNEVFFDVREVKDQKGAPVTKRSARGGGNRDYKFGLVLRPHPHTNEHYNDLDEHVIYDPDVVECSLGKSSNNVVNAFRMYFFGRQLPALIEQKWALLLNMDSITRHGVKRLEGDSQYCWPNKESANSVDKQSDDKQRANIFTVASDYLFDMAARNAVNEDFIEGSITTRLRPSIRVGDRLTFYSSDGDEFYFYIEAVTHSYRYPGPSLTTLTVTRGQVAKLTGETPFDYNQSGSPTTRLSSAPENLGKIGPLFIGYGLLGARGGVKIFSADGSTEIVPDGGVAKADVPTSPKDEAPTSRFATLDEIRDLCKKYGEPDGADAITPAILWGVCATESVLGKHPRPLRSVGKPITNKSPLGLMHINQETATFALGGTVTTDQLLQDNDFNMKAAAATLKKNRGLLKSFISKSGSPAPTPPLLDLTLVAYNEGLGATESYINQVFFGRPPPPSALEPEVPKPLPATQATLASVGGALGSQYVYPVRSNSKGYREA